MQLHCPGFDIEDDLYENLDMDEDSFNRENYDELFGVSLSYSEELLENGGLDSLFRIKGLSAARSGRPAAATAEVLQFPYSNLIVYWELSLSLLHVICYLIL